MVNTIAGIDDVLDQNGVSILGSGQAVFGVSSDWEEIKRVTNPTGTVIEFTDLESSSFDEFELCVYDLDCDTASNNLILQFSTDNGSTYATTASDYIYAFHRGNGESAFAEDRSTTATGIQLSQNFGNSSVRLLSGKWWMGGLDSTSRKHVIGMGSHMNDSGQLRNELGSGVWVGTGSDAETTAFRLTLLAGGNFEGGTVVLRGRRRAGTSLVSQDDWEVISDDTALSAVSSHDMFWTDGVYDEIEITVSGLVTGTDDRDLLMRASTDGSTFLSTGIYDFSQKIINAAYGTSVRGARVNQTADTAAADHDGTFDEWDNEVYDTDGFWASSPNPERLTIPSPTDITKVVVRAGFWLNNVTANTTVFSRIQDDASANLAVHNSSAANSDPAVTHTSGVIDAVAGDYYITGLSLTDTSYVVRAAGSYFSLEVVETIDDQEGYGQADTSVRVARALGTGTNEDVDATIRLTGVAGSKHKKFAMDWHGIIADGNHRDGQGGGRIATTTALQGIQLLMESSATFSADRIRVRGRRVAVQGNQQAGGAFVFMGEWGVATPGDSIIDVDMRSSINPIFADYEDVDFRMVVEGEIGASNGDMYYRVLEDGVVANGAADYKSIPSASTTTIFLQDVTTDNGAGRRFIAEFVVTGMNSSSTSTFDLTGTYFSAQSGGGVNSGPIGGHNNALVAGKNNGFRIQVSAGDLDDMTVRVWAMRRS